MCDEALALLKCPAIESAVLIVTYSPDEGSTGHYKAGLGNYYAQRGSAIEWIDGTRETPAPPAQTDEGDWWKE